MDVLSAFVGVDGLQVAHVSDDVVLVNDAVTTKHVAGIPSDVKGFYTIIPLHDTDHLWSQSVLIL